MFFFILFLAALLHSIASNGKLGTLPATFSENLQFFLTISHKSELL